MKDENGSISGVAEETRAVKRSHNPEIGDVSEASMGGVHEP